MASGSATLALKAAAVAAVLAMLVLPSSARCQGPKPPVPAPAPAMKCSDCGSHCNSTCDAEVPARCTQLGNCGPSSCGDCKTKAIKDCSAGCAGGSSCDDCDSKADTQCGGICSGFVCSECLEEGGKDCRIDCNSKCADTCV